MWIQIRRNQGFGIQVLFCVAYISYQYVSRPQPAMDSLIGAAEWIKEDKYQPGIGYDFKTNISKSNTLFQKL